MSDKSHWENVYAQKKSTEVSWYRPHLDRSLALIAECKLPLGAAIVDIGGGASTLVDDLLGLGYTKLTVVDIADHALAQSKTRLGERAAQVRWLCGDATTPLFDAATVDLWHDRAVFHFLTDEAKRMAYLAEVTRCVRPAGYALLATFALDGPERCSGLPVVRYSPEKLAEALGPSFEKVAEAHEVHATPWGSPQPFAYALCRRVVSG